MKRIISILLVMVIGLTMTACVPPAEAEYERKVEYLNTYDESGIPRITPEEIPDYFAEMVNISATEELQWPDMNAIGSNFASIWEFFNSYCDKTEFEALAIAAFDNVFEQANEQNLPLDNIDAWTYVPVAEVLCKFYSSQNITSPKSPYWSIPFEHLTEEDVISVAEVFFSNPVFATSTEMATSLLTYYPTGKAADLAWEHLVSASKSTDPTLSENRTTYFTCLDIFARHPVLLSNTEKLTEIAKNILQNDNYDFEQKYVYLCSDFCSRSGYEDMDKELNDFAYELLLDLAQNASQEEYEQIAQVVITLYDKYDIESETVTKLLDSYDVKSLVSHLAEWKEISKTKLPRYY